MDLTGYNDYPNSTRHETILHDLWKKQVASYFDDNSKFPQAVFGYLNNSNKLTREEKGDLQARFSPTQNPLHWKITVLSKNGTTTPVRIKQIEGSLKNVLLNGFDNFEKVYQGD